MSLGQKKISLLFIVVSVHLAVAQKPWLSSMNAGPQFPVYTTYAAAMERSDFILDQGYHFRYYEASSGADLITDTGGDIALGFLMNNKWVYHVSDMYAPPTITASYPGLVRYELYPFKNIKVEAFFLVHSSTAAVLQVKLINTGTTAENITIVPFMRKTLSPFREITTSGNGFNFYHEEYPDGWTLSHQLPYTDSIQNYFSISLKPDRIACFNSENGEPPVYPFVDYLEKKSAMSLRGRAFLPGKVRMANAQSALKFQIFSEGNDEVLITENVPIPGNRNIALTNDGYYNFETGLLDTAAKSFVIQGFATEGHLGYLGSLSKEKIRNQRNDIDLATIKLPPSPKSVRYAERSNGGYLSWIGERGFTYDIYKRTQPDLRFSKVATVKENFWIDKKASKKEISSYIVIARGAKNNRSIHSDEVFNLPKSVFRDFIKNPAKQTTEQSAFAKILAITKSFNLKPKQSKSFSIQRSVADAKADTDSLINVSRKLFSLKPQTYISANEKLFSGINVPKFDSKEKEALYWSANNMMRQCFYPPEGKSSYNYYVFSREPTWGWGHGGQVFHESIAMLSYAYIDPVSAMNSQRVYRERQYPNGYINYRTGSYLDEIIEHNGQLTSSAPWYAWLNWEVYLITRDKVFLKEMYESSKKFYRFIVDNRDSDKDGLCEWGGEAVLESVRDALVAVWDEVGYPTNFESLDLNCMLVNEAKSLEKMANELGLKGEAMSWRNDHIKRSELINNTFWDEENDFYYNVDKKNHSFTFKTKNDLKRNEIIGFLPLWAGIATDEKAKRLMTELTDTARFWRKYGVPTLSAKDTYYNPKGYWNGPVWVQWNYLIMRGLLDYGYKTEAKELVERVSKGMIEVLKTDHNLWEFYSPDEPWGGYHKTYIWAGIITRMMMDTNY